MFFNHYLVQVYRIKLFITTIFSSCKYVIPITSISFGYVPTECCCLVLLRSHPQSWELIISISQEYEKSILKDPRQNNYKFTSHCRIGVVLLCARLLSISVYLIHLSSDKCSVMFSSLWRDVVNRLLCLKFVWEFDTMECFGKKLGNTKKFILNHGL